MMTQQAQNICVTFIQRRPNVFDVGPVGSVGFYITIVYIILSCPEMKWIGL